MKRTFLFSFLVLFSTAGFGQSEERDVMAAVVSLFNGMREADTIAVRAAFAPGAVLQTVVEIDGRSAEVKAMTIDAFVKTVGQHQPGVLDERIMFDMVKVDGKLASVWAPYLFNLNGQLSHCGVNSFQLIKSNRGWAIQSVLDTRHKEGCKPSHWFK